MQRVVVSYEELSSLSSSASGAANSGSDLDFDVAGGIELAMPQSSVISRVEAAAEIIQDASDATSTILRDFSEALTKSLELYQESDQSTSIEFEKIETLVGEL